MGILNLHPSQNGQCVSCLAPQHWDEASDTCCGLLHLFPPGENYVP